MTPSHLITVTTWVNWVAEATGVQSGIDPEAAIKTRAGMLGEKYPDSRMFTQASAAFAAMESGVMSLPSVSILGKFLEKWWERNKPAQPMIAAPGTTELERANISGENRALVRIWLRDCADAIRTDREMTHALSVMRRYAPDGYQWLLNAGLDASMRAADIAVRKGWLQGDPRESPSEDEKDAVSAITRQVYDSVEMRTPDPQPPSHATLPSPPPKPAGALSPEQLHALRMNNPALRPLAEREAAREAERKLSAAAPAGDDDWTPSYLRVVP